MCAVKVKRWGFWTVDVSLALLKAGFATVYTGKDAEYGRLKECYSAAEEKARLKGRGMWKQLKTDSYESPADYKRRTKGLPFVTK